MGRLIMPKRPFTGPTQVSSVNSVRFRTRTRRASLASRLASRCILRQRRRPIRPSLYGPSRGSPHLGEKCVEIGRFFSGEMPGRVDLPIQSGEPLRLGCGDQAAPRVRQAFIGSMHAQVGRTSLREGKKLNPIHLLAALRHEHAGA
jgi:hypothetical protein